MRLGRHRQQLKYLLGPVLTGVYMTTSMNAMATFSARIEFRTSFAKMFQMSTSNTCPYLFEKISKVCLDLTPEPNSYKCPLVELDRMPC